MAQTRPPVWRSQLNRLPLRKYVKKRLSGEKKRYREPSSSSSNSKVLSRLRVTASRTSMVLDLKTATNLLHGDHAAVSSMSS